MGFEPEVKALQLDGMDDELRTHLHNVIRLMESSAEKYGIKLYIIYKLLWTHFFILDADAVIGHSSDYIIKKVKSLFDNLAWNGVYDYIEYYLYLINRKYHYLNNLTIELNIVLENHNSAYRIQDGLVIPISNEQELSEVSEASHTGQRAIDTHMRRAIELFSQRESKDYANVIKEAISAVEAAVNIVNGTEGKTLGDALKILEKTRKIPEALKQGFDKLYGYTCDKQTGIRHAMINDAQCPPDFADAKFMLVACSAFVNWLLQKVGSGKA